MKPTRTYATSDIVVYWYPELCVHARYCVNILPLVFRPEQRPWVNLDAAAAKEVILAVDRCPTGALRYSLPEGSTVHPMAAEGPGRQLEGTGDAGGPGEACGGEEAWVRIAVARDGPLLTQGPVKVVDSQGEVVAEAGRLSLCRCGLSGNKPFCDGTHSKKGWKEEQK